MKICKNIIKKIFRSLFNVGSKLKSKFTSFIDKTKTNNSKTNKSKLNNLAKDIDKDLNILKDSVINIDKGLIVYESFTQIINECGNARLSNIISKYLTDSVECFKVQINDIKEEFIEIKEEVSYDITKDPNIIEDEFEGVIYFVRLQIKRIFDKAKKIITVVSNSANTLKDKTTDLIFRMSNAIRTFDRSFTRALEDANYEYIIDFAEDNNINTRSKIIASSDVLAKMLLAEEGHYICNKLLETKSDCCVF